MNSLNKKFHITLIVAAAIGIALLYTTIYFPLIGLATGISLGLSFRLFISHKKSNFVGTKKLDWVLVLVFAALAMILMLAGQYAFQGPALIFVAVRTLVMYFNMYSDQTTPPSKAP